MQLSHRADLLSNAFTCIFPFKVESRPKKVQETEKRTSSSNEIPTTKAQFGDPKHLCNANCFR